MLNIYISHINILVQDQIYKFSMWVVGIAIASFPEI